jgi:hypothetical protein
MHRKRFRPVKVFITTSTGYKTYLVENNDVLVAIEPFVRRFHEMGFEGELSFVRENLVACLMTNKHTKEPVMLSSWRLYDITKRE